MIQELMNAQQNPPVFEKLLLACFDEVLRGTGGATSWSWLGPSADPATSVASVKSLDENEA